MYLSRAQRELVWRSTPAARRCNLAYLARVSVSSQKPAPRQCLLISGPVKRHAEYLGQANFTLGNALQQGDC